MSQLPQTQPEWLTGVLDKVQQSNDALVETVRQENKQTLAALGGQINEIKKEQQRHGQQIGTLQKEVKALKQGSTKGPSGSDASCLTRSQWQGSVNTDTCGIQFGLARCSHRCSRNLSMHYPKN